MKLTFRSIPVLKAVRISDILFLAAVTMYCTLQWFRWDPKYHLEIGYTMAAAAAFAAVFWIASAQLFRKTGQEHPIQKLAVLALLQAFVAGVLTLQYHFLTVFLTKTMQISVTSVLYKYALALVVALLLFWEIVTMSSRRKE